MLFKSLKVNTPWLLPGRLVRAGDIAVAGLNGVSRVLPVFSTCPGVAGVDAQYRSMRMWWRDGPWSRCRVTPLYVYAPTASDLLAGSPLTLPTHLHVQTNTCTYLET